jgi:hypothetical protein
MCGDNRLDTVNPGGKLYDIFMAESTDNGASFSPNIRVTNVSSDPDLDGFNGTFIGDYFGLSASGVPVWSDTRNLNQDIFGAPGESGNDLSYKLRIFCPSCSASRVDHVSSRGEQGTVLPRGDARNRRFQIRSDFLECSY